MDVLNKQAIEFKKTGILLVNQFAYPKREHIISSDNVLRPSREETPLVEIFNEDDGDYNY